MSQDNIATGHSPTDELLPTIDDDKQPNLDQLLSAGIMLTTQPSPLIPFNPTTNMITNITQSNDTLNRQDITQNEQYQQANQERLNERQQFQQELQRLRWEQGQNQREQHRIRQRLQSEQQRQRQEQQRLRQQQQNKQRLRRQQRNQRRYEQWQERVRQRQHTGHQEQQQQQQHYDRYRQRYSDHYEEERLERAHDTYLARRSPTYNEFADEVLTERELEQYYFNRMPPQDRQYIWEQEHLNELQGYPTNCPLVLPPNHIEKYTEILTEQMSIDQYEQVLQVNEMEKNDYIEECRRNQELLIQNQEWEDLAFRLQQQLQ